MVTAGMMLSWHDDDDRWRDAELAELEETSGYPRRRGRGANSLAAWQPVSLLCWDMPTRGRLLCTHGNTTACVLRVLPCLMTCPL